MASRSDSSLSLRSKRCSVGEQVQVLVPATKSRETSEARWSSSADLHRESRGLSAASGPIPALDAGFSFGLKSKKMMVEPAARRAFLKGTHHVCRGGARPVACKTEYPHSLDP